MKNFIQSYVFKCIFGRLILIRNWKKSRATKTPAQLNLKIFMSMQFLKNSVFISANQGLWLTKEVMNTW